MSITAPRTPQAITSPSAWSYLDDQENGDNVDCWSCGNPLNDDLPIVNDADGHALHDWCAEDDRAEQVQEQHQAVEVTSCLDEQVRACTLSPGDVVTIPEPLIGAGQRRIVTAPAVAWPGGRVLVFDTRTEDWSRAGELVLAAETTVLVRRGVRREEVEAHNAAAAAVAASDRIAADRARRLA